MEPLSVALADDPAEQEAANASEGEQIFVRRIYPLLQSKCIACHGADPDDLQGGLDLRTRQAALVGGDSNRPALVPDHADHSPLYLAVARQGDWSPMPPKENDAVSEQGVEQVRRWIELGAPWPSEERVAQVRAEYDDLWSAEGGVRVTTSGGLSPEWTDRRYEPEDLWAYRPIDRESLAGLGTTHHTIDQLIDERLEDLGLTPAKPASRRELIRRATYDLTGLPPTAEEIKAFLTEPADDTAAFAALVDRLLASPHYGERWGQHWLDVTRYADSSGFANDYDRGNAWRYRDYVVRSFNDDKPYNRFVQEQIAGDELDPQDPEMLVAVGFLRMGPWELSTMEVPKVARQRFLDDVTDSVGQVFLGHMLQCARCHDHKFDPVPTRDYYSIQAVFATTQVAERQAEFLSTENTDGFAERRLEQARKDHWNSELERLNNHSVEAAREWLKERRQDLQPFEDCLIKAGGDYEGARSLLLQSGLTEDQAPPRHAGFTAAEHGLSRIAKKCLQRLDWQLERYEPYALSVYNGATPSLTAINSPRRVPEDTSAGTIESTAILTGGDPFSPAQAVQPGVLSAVAGLSGEQVAATSANLRQVSYRPGATDPTVSGRRLAFAEWVTSPENPLTARVMANRIWNGHFGRGIAANPNNFGATGGKPTHPRLLDWLAQRLINSGWSIKQLHRDIMLSEAYRRSCEPRDQTELARLDPKRESYAAFTPRRLTAEELRDSLLAASGELNRQVGGIPCRPEINREVALQPRQVMGGFAEAWQPSLLPAQRHRRALYALRLRGLPDPFMEVFNSPSPDLSTESRGSSTVSPQAFTLLNGQFAYARALALAHRVGAGLDLQRETPRRRALSNCFRLAYGRAPSDEQARQCLAHWETMRERHRRTRLNPVDYPEEVVRKAVDEATGEAFTFSEPLPAVVEMQHDLRPKDTSIEIRALADVCLVLFNSNEFAYVY